MFAYLFRMHTILSAFVNLPPLENQIESGWRVWLDTGFAAAAR